MTTTDAAAAALERDSRVSQAQAAYLGRCAPGYRTWRATWSGGTTQVIELGDGPPLLLVHGGLGEAFQWGPILAPLAQRHRVLAVDRPGHGLADPFDYRNVDVFEHARRFLSDILDAAGLRAAPIVASSMGGLWAVVFALAYPERVPALVLPGATAGISRALPLGFRLGMFPLLKSLVRSLMKRPTRESVRGFWKQLLVAHPERLGDDFLDLTVASQLRNTPSWFSLLDRCNDPGGFKRELVLGEKWKQLSVPTTFVWGEKDAFGRPELAEAVAATNPLLRVVRIPDAGHAPWFDAPGLVVGAIEAAIGSADREQGRTSVA